VCKTSPMLGTVWGWVTASIGLAIVALLFVYGYEYGIWLDEVGPLTVAPPTFLLPFAIGGLGVVLLIGGFVVGVTEIIERAQSRSESRSTS
jgi:hypothetical protein